MCLDFLYNLCLKHFSFQEELSEIWAKPFIGLRVKYPLFLSEFTETWTFTTHFQKIVKYQISRKSVQWEQNCSMREDGRTDMTKLIVAFRNFANFPKNAYQLNHAVNTYCSEGWRGYMFVYTGSLTSQEFTFKKFNVIIRVWSLS
jgi:hypothetical protein